MFSGFHARNKAVFFLNNIKQSFSKTVDTGNIRDPESSSPTPFATSATPETMNRELLV